MTTYETRFSRKCPVNPDVTDHYDLIVEAEFTPVERILAGIDALPEKGFQEDLTKELAAILQCKVTTVGYHSGVKTTCVEGE